MLTAERARELLHYDGENLIWKQYRAGNAKKGDIAGRITTKGYRSLTIDRKRYYAHQVIWLIVHGHWPTHAIDHEDQNKLNNRIGNFRDVPQAINAKNKPKPSNNTSGTIGVYWDKKRRKWQAIIKVNRKQIPLGRFTDKADAIAARRLAEEKHGFHTNHGR